MKKDLMNAVWICVIMAALAQSCGVAGPSGQSGSNGLDGANGATGATGADAASVYAVQFCHGTTHYPDTFCEVGFCVAGSLYATYSTNGGFSVLIPPGTYQSHGINCSCTFTVTQGCGVQ